MCLLEKKRGGRNKVKLMEHKLRMGGKRFERNNTGVKPFICKQDYHVDTVAALTTSGIKIGLQEI